MQRTFNLLALPILLAPLREAQCDGNLSYPLISVQCEYENEYRNSTPDEPLICQFGKVRVTLQQCDAGLWRELIFYVSPNQEFWDGLDAADQQTLSWMQPLDENLRLTFREIFSPWGWDVDATLPDIIQPPSRFIDFIAPLLIPYDDYANDRVKWSLIPTLWGTEPTLDLDWNLCGASSWASYTRSEWKSAAKDADCGTGAGDPALLNFDALAKRSIEVQAAAANYDLDGTGFWRGGGYYEQMSIGRIDLGLQYVGMRGTEIDPTLYATEDDIGSGNEGSIPDGLCGWEDFGNLAQATNSPPECAILLPAPPLFGPLDGPVDGSDDIVVVPFIGFVGNSRVRLVDSVTGDFVWQQVEYDGPATVSFEMPGTFTGDTVIIDRLSNPYGVTVAPPGGGIEIDIRMSYQ